MSKFTDLTLDKSVDDMTEDEAKETLAQFMESHQKNQTAYDELQTEYSDAQDEYEAKLEEKRERITEFREEKANKAADYVKMPAPLLAERFSISELDQIIAEGEEADFSEDDSSEESEEKDLTTFSEKEEKGKAESGGNAKARERARDRLMSKGFPGAE